MKLSLIVALLALSVASASAQQPAPKEYVINHITADEVNLIGRALGEMPYSKVAPLIAKLMGQISSQEAFPAPAPVPAVPKESPSQ